MDIVEIRQRAEKATPGPWSLRPAEWECDCGGDEDGNTHKAPDQCRDGWWRDAAWVAGPILIEHGDGWTGFNDADADFMAHAREDVPALCDALVAAQESLDVLLKPVVGDWMALREFIGDSDEAQGAMIAVTQTIAQAIARAEEAEEYLADMTVQRDAQRFRAEQIEEMAEAKNVLLMSSQLDAALARAKRAEAALIEHRQLSMQEHGLAIRQHADVVGRLEASEVALAEYKANIPWESMWAYFSHGDYGPDAWQEVDEWIRTNMPHELARTWLGMPEAQP
jgi:hypothetical protein